MNTYITSDYYCSAFLVASGIPMVAFEKINGRTEFTFAETDRLPQLVEEYYAGQAQISAIRYGNSLKNLKAIIYSANTNMNKHENHRTHNNSRATK